MSVRSPHEIRLHVDDDDDDDDDDDVCADGSHKNSLTSDIRCLVGMNGNCILACNIKTASRFRMKQQKPLDTSNTSTHWSRRE